MSEINRNAGRKAWLLSSASGAVLLAGMVAMTPEQAEAACTGTNTVNCTGSNSFNSTRSYNPSGNFTLNFGDGVSMTTVTATGNGSNGDGIRIFGGNILGVPYGTSNPVTVDLPVLSSVNANRDGLFVMTDGRNNPINITASGNITAQRTGIVAVAGNALGSPGAGGITVNNNGSIQAGSGPAILAYRQNATNSDANKTVTITNAGTLKSVSGHGIVVGNSVGDPYGLGTTVRSEGTASITNNKTIDVAGHGIWSNATDGASISNGSAGEIIAGGDGIAAYGVALGVELATGGDVDVLNEGSVKGGRHGVNVNTEGDTTVTNQAGATLEGIAGDGVRLRGLGDATVYNDGGSILGGDNGVSAVASGTFLVDNRSTGLDGSTIQGVSSGIRFGTSLGGVPVPHLGDVEILNGADDVIRATSGDGIAGIATGEIVIANLTGGTIDGATNGINVVSLLDDVNVANGGAVTAGQNGILAFSTIGNVVIDGEDDGSGGKIYGSVDATSGTGILGVALGGGDVTIDAGALHAGGANAFTIPIMGGIGIGGGVVGVATGVGNVDVNLHGNVSVDSGLVGGAAIALGDGAATVKLDDGVNIDPPAIGMLAATVGGLATVDIGDNSFVDATLAGAVGLNFGAGGIDVTVGDGSTIGQTDVPQFGIVTLDTDGAAATTITLGADSLVRGQSSGVVAMATEAEVRLTSKGSTILGGGGALSPAVAMMSGVSNVINNQTGDLGGVHHRGTIGQAGADGGFAIFSAGGELSLVNQGDIHGRIVALTTDGGSNVFVNSMSASPLATQGGVWNTSGISVFAATGASGGNAIVNHDKAAINVTGNAAIGLVSEGGANTVTNEVGGVININAGATPGLSTVAALGLASETGHNMIDNRGTMNLGGATVIGFASEDGSNRLGNSGTLNAIGVTTFGFASETGSNEFDNHGTFRAEGVTTLGFATDTGSNWVHNASIMSLTGITTFAFTAPTGASEFDNDGVMNVNGLASFAGLDTFYNNNLINMANGIPDWGMAPSPYYGSRVGDITAMTGDFNAGAGSKLAIDAILAGRYNSASDLLVVGGDVTGGPTAVHVNFDPTAIAEHNPFGTPVVGVVGGNTALGDFYLANGPIDRGLFRYDLFLDEPDSPAPAGSKSWVLASYADGSAYALSEFAGLAQGIWNTTSDSWIDRAGDLRVSSQQGPGDPAKKTGIWGRFIGNGAERSTERTITPFQNQSVTIDTGYDQTLWGFQVGLDHEFEGNVADGVLIAGVLGGYVSSNADFNSGDSVRFSGPQVGVYASWVKGGLYVDGLVKGDFLKADYNVAGSDSDTDSTTIGVRVETGYRYFTSTGMFIEPNASLAYAHSSIDDVTVAGTPVRFDDGDGLEGKLGARFGGSSLKDGVKYDPYLSVGIAGNLLSDNSVFFSSGPGLVVEDDAPDVFGEVGAGINIFSTKSGWTGFAKADLRFGDDYVGGTGKIGVNWAW